MAELSRGGLLDTSVSRIDGKFLDQTISEYDIMRPGVSGEVVELYKSAPGGRRNLVLGSQENYYKELDTDRKSGCIRSIDNAYNKDGGLAVLYGNIARKGSIIKTAGVDPVLYMFVGTAKVFDSQEDACNGILDNNVQPGDAVVIRYEGPKGGPGMQEMLYPTSYLKSMKLDKQCALITDGRFSGGTSGLSAGHVSPEAAAGGELALIKNGDRIEFDILNRSINLLVTEEELEKRRSEEEQKGKEGWKPNARKRQVSKALKAYASMVSSADLGAIRIIES
jgi:dihydroxy-acid dehydratase